MSGGAVPRRPLAPLLLALCLLAAACSDGDDSAAVVETPAASLTVYSGRDEALLRPVVEQFEAETGIDVEVRSGDPVELAGAILDEGVASPADLFYGPSVVGLGPLAQAGRLQALPPSALDRVDPRFRAPDGRWMGISGRTRVAAYNTSVLRPGDLPESVFELTGATWDGGRIGWAPSDPSFRTFVTALRAVVGEEAARGWLAGMTANAARAFPDDAAVVAAVAAGDLALGLVDHPATSRFLRTQPAAPVANHLFPADGLGSLVLASGVGIVDSASHVEEARRFVELLVSEPVQEYFAAEAYEIPLVPGIATVAPLPPIESLPQPAVDPVQLTDRQATDALLAELGII